MVDGAAVFSYVIENTGFTNALHHAANLLYYKENTGNNCTYVYMYVFCSVLWEERWCDDIGFYLWTYQRINKLMRNSM